MNTATGYESGVPVSCVDTSHALAPITKQIRVTRPQRYYVAAFAIALPALFIGLPNRGVKDVVQLERLAPKIERAQALSPDARETIGRLVARQSALATANSDALQVRRRAAIERVTSAMNAKQVASVGGGGYRPQGH